MGKERGHHSSGRRGAPSPTGVEFLRLQREYLADHDTIPADVRQQFWRQAASQTGNTSLLEAMDAADAARAASGQG